MRPFVVYWNNMPSPYMVERFNALADRGAFDFEAWFNDRIEPDRSWNVNEAEWRFRYRYLPVTRFLDRRLHWPVPIFGRRPDLLVSWYAQPSFLFGWAIAKLRGVKTGFRIVKTFDRWVPRHPVKEAIKRFVFKRVDAVETVGEDGRSFAIRYGAQSDKIYIATHAIDVPHFASACAIAKVDGKAARKTLGLRGVTFVYVGRLWWGKGLNYLLTAFERVQRASSTDVSLLVIGDGPDERKLRQICSDRGIRNVVFAGFKQKPELPKFYALGDVFVFPTLGDPYGLVVDEAMACSLPVISTAAAGEIRRRVEEGVNGFVVPAEDSDTLAERMLRLVGDPDLRLRMGQSSFEKIKDNTPDKWAREFESIVRNVLRGR